MITTLEKYLKAFYKIEACIYLLLGNSTPGNPNELLKHLSTKDIIAALFIIAQAGNNPTIYPEKKIKKLQYIYITEYDPAIIRSRDYWCVGGRG